VVRSASPHARARDALTDLSLSIAFRPFLFFPPSTLRLPPAALNTFRHPHSPLLLLSGRPPFSLRHPPRHSFAQGTSLRRLRSLLDECWRYLFVGSLPECTSRAGTSPVFHHRLYWIPSGVFQFFSSFSDSFVSLQSFASLLVLTSGLYPSSLGTGNLPRPSRSRQCEACRSLRSCASSLAFLPVPRVLPAAAAPGPLRVRVDPNRRIAAQHRSRRNAGAGHGLSSRRFLHYEPSRSHFHSWDHVWHRRIDGFLCHRASRRYLLPPST
jgi:hypothetical protein